MYQFRFKASLKTMFKRFRIGLMITSKNHCWTAFNKHKQDQQQLRKTIGDVTKIDDVLVKNMTSCLSFVLFQVKARFVAKGEGLIRILIFVCKYENKGLHKDKLKMYYFIEKG